MLMLGSILLTLISFLERNGVEENSGTDCWHESHQFEEIPCKMMPCQILKLLNLGVVLDTLSCPWNQLHFLLHKELNVSVRTLS